MKNEEGKRLRLFMEREGITQYEMAAESKKPQSTINKYLSGDLKIPLDFVKFLHIKYKVNYTWFFHSTGTMKYKDVAQRKLTTDITDILASIGAIMASQESMRDAFNRLAADYYADKRGVKN